MKIKISFFLKIFHDVIISEKEHKFIFSDRSEFRFHPIHKLYKRMDFFECLSEKCWKDYLNDYKQN